MNENDFINHVKSELENAINQSGLTRKELCERLDITNAALAQALKKESNVTLRTLARIASAINYNIAVKFTYNTPPSSAPDPDQD